MKEQLYVLKNKFLAFKRWEQAGILALVGIITLCTSLLLLRATVAYELIDELPSEEDIATIDNPLASELYTAEQKLIGKYYSENRSSLNAAQLNDNFVNALIATEDVRFYKHDGVDTRSLFRVLLKTILLRKDASGGGSTLTQQLVKNIYPRKRYRFLSTLINKFREMSIAKRVEAVYTKEEILLLYANTVSFGERVFGLGTAAQRFFNKNPKALSLDEAATLVGMLKATSHYSPRNHPERATVRRNTVLDQMAKYEFITRAIADTTKSIPLSLDYQAPSEIDELARYFKQRVKSLFAKWSTNNPKEDGSTYNIYTDGLKIYTSLDYNMQIAAEKSMQSHMTTLQKSFLNSWKGGRMFGKGTKIIDDQILSDPHYKSLRKQGLSNKEALAVFSAPSQKMLWNWDGYKLDQKTKIDSIKHYLSMLHTGLLAADPQSGAIKVWIGGNDYGHFQYDNILSPRQVGSTFKPIVYLAALESGKEPCDFFENELRQYSSFQDWTPKNADGKYGGYATMQGALTHSINTVSVQLLFETGINKVVALAKRLGIGSKLNEVPSIVLGTSDISLHEMVSTYAVFANKGVRKPLYIIDKIEDQDGHTLFQRQEVLDTSVVDKDQIEKLDQMLTSVTKNGTGRRLYANYKIPFDVKGKTGTTQNQSDGWFIGYTDDLVVGAWVGTNDRRMHFRSLRTGSGGRTALPLVGALFEYAGSNYERQSNKPNLIAEDELTFSCPDTLSTQAYEYYQRRQEYESRRAEEPKNFFERLFGKRKRTVNPKYNSRERKRLQELERERKERIKKYNDAQKAWEKRLKKLRKKYEDN